MFGANAMSTPKKFEPATTTNASMPHLLLGKPEVISLSKKEPSKIVLPTPDTSMNLEQAMEIMKAARPALAKDPLAPSILNPSITQIDAWEIVWRTLVGEQAKLVLGTVPVSLKSKLSTFMVKRVRQVCLNKLNPDLPDEATLPPVEPDPPPVPIKKPKPYERKFS